MSFTGLKPIPLFDAGMTTLKSLQIASSKVTDNGVAFLRGRFCNFYEDIPCVFRYL